MQTYIHNAAGVIDGMAYLSKEYCTLKPSMRYPS